MFAVGNILKTTLQVQSAGVHMLEESGSCLNRSAGVLVFPKEISQKIFLHDEQRVSNANTNTYIQNIQYMYSKRNKINKNKNKKLEKEKQTITLHQHVD